MRRRDRLCWEQDGVSRGVLVKIPWCYQWIMYVYLTADVFLIHMQGTRESRERV